MNANCVLIAYDKVHLLIELLDVNVLQRQKLRTQFTVRLQDQRQASFQHFSRLETVSIAIITFLFSLGVLHASSVMQKAMVNQ